jgi:hypothetical protein
MLGNLNSCLLFVTSNDNTNSIRAWGFSVSSENYLYWIMT